MLKSPLLSARRRLCLRAVAQAAVAAFIIASGAVAHAAPDAAGDAIARFLSERGLDNGAAPSRTTEPLFVTQVRNKASELVISAMNFLGVPYRRGGNTAGEGFDCSGFTRYVFENTLGLALPRRVDEQAGATGLVPIKRDELKPGDLVFFNTLKRTFSHVGIYVGEGRFIHAPRTGAKVRVEDMSHSYWSKRYTGGRRAAAADDTPVPVPSATTAATGDTTSQPIWH
jgi:cell wall-associated NlpC family hydrolase